MCELSSRAQLWAAVVGALLSGKEDGEAGLWGGFLPLTSPAQPLADAFCYSALPLLQLGRWRGRLRKLSHPFAEKEQGSKVSIHLWDESKA